MPRPAEFDETPELSVEEAGIYAAFQTLSAARGAVAAGMTVIPARLSYEAVADFLDRFGPASPDDWLFWLRAVLALDGEYVLHAIQSLPKPKR